MLPLELLYEQYKQISKTCKEVFIDKFYVHMPKIVEEQKEKNRTSPPLQTYSICIWLYSR